MAAALANTPQLLCPAESK